jgi:hypothetical protein
VVNDERLVDVVGAAEEILSRVSAAPPHIRPWLRGLEAEAEHVIIEVDAVRNRATSRFLSWTLAGRLHES